MSSKKDSLAQSIGAGAGELALNLFDKLKKKSNNSSENNLAANLISNFANNIQKNLMNNQKSNISLSKLLAEQTAPEKNSVLVYDDEIDDPDTSVAEVQINKSQSDINLSLKNKNSKIAPSSSLTNSLNKTSEENSAASSPKSKITSVIDEILKSDLANSVVDTATAEAESLRKRILTKKKSIELSLENIKSKKAKPTESSASTPISSSASLESTTVQEISNHTQPKEESQLEVLPSTQANIELTQEPVLSNLETNSREKIEQSQNWSLNDKRTKILACVISILVYLILVPKKLSIVFLIYWFGFLSGAVLAGLATYAAIKYDFVKYILKEEKKTQEQECKTQPSEQEMQALLIQTAIKKENKNFDGVYKGWMNELREVYDPQNYFINKTRSVYLNLDGVMLRLQTTTSRVPKRAVPGEQIGSVTFNEQRMYDLTGCEVSILPKELCRKRYWSKKYPICLKGVKLLSKKCSNGDLLNPANSSEDQDKSNKDLDINTLILFSRTDREKEEWFNLFRKASSKNLLDSAHYTKQKKVNLCKENSQSSLVSPVSPDSVVKLSYSVTNDKIIYKINDSAESDKSSSSSSSSNDINSILTQTPRETQTEGGLLYDSSLNFMNTFLIRIFADFFNHQHWIELIQNKIQNKLNKIKIPYFMEELKITGIDLGSVIPLIKQASEPWYDEKGLWVHLDLDYSGSIQMSLSTKLNLMKLKSQSSTSSLTPTTVNTNNNTPIFSFRNENNEEPSLNILLNSSQHGGEDTETSAFDSESRASLNHDRCRKNLAIQNSDEEDSPESSGDEYVHSGFMDEENKLVETTNASKKLLNMVNKIAVSNYFQKATENKYVKMLMENVSNCQLLLNVEVKKITGTLALNIPPHPSDRLWYGFIKKPHMVLVATPQVGEKEVSYSAISDFIADKLKLEFQKVLVFPNMDDFYIPLLKSEVNS